MLSIFSEPYVIGTKMYGPSYLGDLFNILRCNDRNGYKNLPFSYYDLEKFIVRTLGVKNMNYVKDKIEDCRIINQIQSDE